MSLPDIELSQYTQISENEERMVIVDYYVIGTIAATLSTLILFSMTKVNRNTDNKYYRYAIICGIISATSATIFFSIRILFCTDLIFPYNYAKNVNIATLLDSFLFIFWTIGKIAFYFGFTYLYLSLFQKDKIDILLKILMVVVVIGICTYMIMYFTLDVMTTEFDEIFVGAKRGIFGVMTVHVDETPSIAAFMIAIVAEFALAIVLTYRFYSKGTKLGDRNGTKGIVLLVISCLAWIFLFGIYSILYYTDKHLYFEFAIDGLPTLIDTICLYLMFEDNQEIYNNLCGNICGGSKYEPVQVDDEDDEVDDDNQQLV